MAMFILSFFLALSVENTFMNQTYVTQQLLSNTTIFRHCKFSECVTGGPEGAAISFVSEYSDLGIANCEFRSCKLQEARIWTFGGGIFATCGSFSLNDTRGDQCCSDWGSFFWVLASSLGNVKVEVNRCSIYNNSAYEGGTLMLFGPYGPIGSYPARIITLNSTANRAPNLGAGFWVNCDILRFSYSRFLSNVRHNCLLFDRAIRDDEVSCLLLQNNTAQGRILIRVDSSVSIRHSLFQANTFTYFVGTASHLASLTLVSCIVDFQDFPHDNEVIFDPQHVVLIHSPLIHLDSGGCPWPDPTATRSPRPQKRLSAGALAGVILVVVVVVGVAAFLVVYFVRKSRQSVPLPYQEVIV